MDPAKLDLASLPAGERRFIGVIAGGFFPAYGVGFVAELATLNQLADHFRYLNEFANVALLRVGSGGRFEGAALGETEFVLLTQDSMGDDWAPPAPDENGTRVYPHQYYDKLVATSRSDIFGVGPTPCMKVSLEHKRLDGPDQLSYYAGNDTPFPGRILEAEFVAGNRALAASARRRVFAEIAADTRIVTGMKKDLTVYKKVCQTGVSRKIRQFDTEKNEVFFNPPARQYGLKYGLLRYTQTALSIELFELVQRRKLPIDDYLDLPQSVEERIRYAFRKGWVAREDDLTVAGMLYIRAADFNNTAKIRYYTDDTTVAKLEDGSLREVHNDIVAVFANRLLAD